MPAEPVLLERIPVAKVGTWSASTGEWEATRAKFDSAVRASKDGTLRQARLFIGHNEERIKTGMDTVPAVGLAPRLVHEDDVLYADHLVPPGLAATAKLHFPSRSIEAVENYTAPSGETYEMYVTGIAWLGDELPAVDTLPDLAQLWGLAPDEFAIAASGAERPRLIVCALGEGAPPASAGSTNPRQEASMPTPAPAEEPKTPAPDPKATEPTGPSEPKTEPKADAPTEPAKTEQPKAGDPKVDATPQIPEGFIFVEKGKWDELNAKLAQLDTLVADKSERDAEEYTEGLVAAGRIAASSKAKIAEQYKANPEGTRAICDLLPEGAHEPPPTGRVAATRAAEETDGGELMPSLITLTPAERRRAGKED